MYYKYRVKSPAIAKILTSLVKHKKKELNNTYSEEMEKDYIGPRNIFYFAKQVFYPHQDKWDNNLHNYFGFACPNSAIDDNGVKISLEKAIKYILL